MAADRPPRLPPLRGRMEAEGLFLEQCWVPAAEARRRLVDLWCPGARVLEVRGGEEGGWLLLWPGRRWLRAAELPGEPLVAYRAGWRSIPWPESPDDDAMTAQTWQRRRAGKIETIDLDDQPEIEVASWLAIGGWPVVETQSLGEPPPPPQAPPELAPSLEEHFGLAGERAPARKLARQLTAKAKQRRAAGGWRWLLRRLEGPAGSAGGAGGSLARGYRWGGSEPERARRPLLDLLRHSIGRLLRRFHNRALYEVHRLFEKGDLEEALRRAPAAGKPGGQELPTAWGLSGRRDRLQIGHSPAPAATIYGDPEVLALLRDSYERAAELLAATGRLDRAAFVLAELVGEPMRAVELYEKHGLLQKAAEVAVVSDLDPAIAVRFFFLAGEVRRAVDLARLRGAFASAVRELEKRGEPLAQELRRLWAEHLADTQHWSAALEAIWPCEDRGPAEEWTELGLVHPVSAADAARLLLYQMDLRRSSEAAMEATMERWQHLLEHGLRSAEGSRGTPASDAQVGRQIGTAILRHPSPHHALVRQASRRLLRQGAGPQPNELQRLIRLSGDAALRADCQKLDLPSPSRDLVRSQTCELALDTRDRGTSGIHDAVPLVDGRILVALGEEGVVELDRQGRQRRHFGEPAHHLVIADHGRAAITLADRDSVKRLGRLDLDRGRAERWTDAVIHRFATSYDGDRFLVTSGDVLWVIDARAPDWRALWRVPDLPLPICGLARDKSSLALCFAEPAEIWRWDQTMTLRERRVSEPESLDGPWLLTPDGTLAWADGLGSLVSQGPQGGKPQKILRIQIRISPSTQIGRIGGSWFRIDEDLWRRLPVGTGRVRFTGAGKLQARPGQVGEARHLALWDDRGRLVVLGLEGRRLELDVRL